MWHPTFYRQTNKAVLPTLLSLVRMTGYLVLYLPVGMVEYYKTLQHMYKNQLTVNILHIRILLMQVV